MTSGQGPAGREPQPGAATQDEDDLGGDPACWLRRVCPACGNLAPTDPPVICPNCHAEITGE